MSQIPRERWISNLITAAQDIADKEHQRRWLAPDRYAWERPEELINLVDAFILDGFIDEFSLTFSENQRNAAVEFRDELSDYCDQTPQNLEPAVVLADPRWEAMREKAAAFVVAFKDKWP